MRYILLFPILAISLVKGAIIGEWDDVNRDAYEPEKGFLCTERYVEPSLKWYVDMYREKIYPFWYLGCGGDENVYDNALKAEKALPSDSAQCEGFNMTGWPEYGSTESEHHCPVGSTYLPYGEFSAICCDNDTAERYRKFREAKCPNDEDLLMIEVVHMDPEFDDVESFRENRTLYGKRCSHEFCPKGSICVQGEFEAYCCPNSKPLSTEHTAEGEIPPERVSLSGGLVSWFRRLLDESSLLILFLLLFVTLAILTFIVSFLIYISCRTNRARNPIHQKYGDAKETMTLNP